MKGLLVVVLVLALVFMVEVIPHLEGTIAASGDKMSDSLGYTPDTSQLGGVKTLVWGAGSILALFGIMLEITERRH